MVNEGVDSEAEERGKDEVEKESNTKTKQEHGDRSSKPTQANHTSACNETPGLQKGDRRCAPAAHYN